MRNETATRGIILQPREERLFAFTVVFLFLIYAGVTIAHHEMWRDELQAWLLSRDSSTLLSVFHNIRYEGHPPLWYLLLWPLTHLTKDPSIIQWLNLIIAAGAVYIVAMFAPVPRWARAAAVFGYFPVYEYGSIARNYAIGLFAIVAFCALFQYRRRHPVALGIVLFLAANTSLHACILAIAALSLLVSDLTIHRPEPTRRMSNLAGLGIAAGGIILAAFQMNPPPDTGFAAIWYFTPDSSAFVRVLQTVIKGYLPLPWPGPGFWETNLLDSIPGFAKFSWISALIVLAVASLSLIRRPLALIYYLIGSFGLLTFFYVKHLGYVRHHGFLYICFCTAFWLAVSMTPVSLPKTLDVAGRCAERVMHLLLPLLLAVHIVGAVIAVAREYRHVFSAAKSTAELIRKNGLDRYPLVTDDDYLALAVVGYLDAPRVYNPRGGRFGSYIIWDSQRSIRYNAWLESVKLAKQLNSPVVLVIDKESLKRGAPPDQMQSFFKLVDCRYAEIVRIESFCVFVVDNNP